MVEITLFRDVNLPARTWEQAIRTEGGVELDAGFIHWPVERKHKGNPMIELHFYGDLRRYVQEKTTGGHSVMQLPVGSGETVGNVLRGVGVDPTDVGQIFLNGRLLNTRCSMAPWLGYQSAQERVPIGGSYLDALVYSGDRLGVFPTKMAMLVV
jgi:hypothetical protein